MNEKPTDSKELAELDLRVEQLKGFLASHPAGKSLPPASSPSNRPEARWSIFSLLSPLLVGLPAYAVASAFIGDSGWGWGYLGRILVAVGASSILGMMAVVVAMVRGERHLGIIVLAFCIHIVPILWFLASCFS